MAGTKGNQGFASMKKEDQRAAASKGGKTTGGKNLTQEARSRGGKNSHRSDSTTSS